MNRNSHKLALVSFLIGLICGMSGCAAQVWRPAKAWGTATRDIDTAASDATFPGKRKQRAMRFEQGGNPALTGQALRLDGPGPDRNAVGNELRGGDPFVLQGDGTRGFLYTTNRPGVNVPAYRSNNLVDWHYVGDALPVIPSWAARGKTWAPEVLQLSPSQFVLFFAAEDKDSGKQCLGRATGTNPTGPFTSNDPRPFLCHPGKAATIDPSPFRDADQKLYLLWKTREDRPDGSKLTQIWIQPLTPQGVLAESTPQSLISNDLPWEGKHVEAPSLVKHRGRYFLFYSAGASTAMHYSISYATADKVVGPYDKAPENPIVRSNASLRGPGHQSVYPLSQDSYILFFHANFPERKALNPGAARYVESVHLCFPAQKPVPQDDACPVP